jgi:hypothetical protein
LEEGYFNRIQEWKLELAIFYHFLGSASLANKNK